MNGNYQEIALSEIRPCPQNPRKSFKGRSFDELVESIAQKGVIEPIVVRPIKKDGRAFEIVAGERRFRAKVEVALKKETIDHETIPAVVRQLTDDEAFEFMIIENLQREDLTDLEEAQSFKAFVERRPKEQNPIEELAARTGLNPRYIRSRVDVLSLPDYILEAWDKGRLAYGHLVQFLRIDDPKRLKELYQMTGEGYRGQTVQGLKHYIDSESPSLSSALFNLKEKGCTVCPKNSKVQKALWEFGDDRKFLCLDPKCFIQNQREALEKDWTKTPFHKEYKTTGFRFKEEIDWNSYSRFHDYPGAFKPQKKCFSCEKFLTVLTYLGKVDEGRACFNPRCMAGMERAKEEGKKVSKAHEGPRVAWHGEFFREEFLAQRIPEKIKEHAPLDDEDTLRLALFGFAVSDFGLESSLEDYLEEDGIFKDTIYNKQQLWSIIEKLDTQQAKKYIMALAQVVILDKQGVNHKARLLIAKFLGINLMREFSVTEDYLKKKTIKEIIEFGNESKLFKDKKVLGYLNNTIKKERFEKCKKVELIDLFMKSGVNLVGKVPTEVVPPKMK